MCFFVMLFCFTTTSAELKHSIVNCTQKVISINRSSTCTVDKMKTLLPPNVFRRIPIDYVLSNTTKKEGGLNNQKLTSQFRNVAVLTNINQTHTSDETTL